MKAPTEINSEYLEHSDYGEKSAHGNQVASVNILAFDASKPTESERSVSFGIAEHTLKKDSDLSTPL